MSFVIGISQGIQPIIGFNYGAEKYERVRKSYLLALGTATVLSGIAFFCFQVFPRQIISVFGSGSELYFQFSERYFRIYMFLTLINGIQPVTSNFFNSIGKSQLGVFMSLTRQILFLLPLIVIFPLFMGIDGVMYAGPIADAAAAIVCGYFMVRELKELSVMDKKKKEVNYTKVQKLKASVLMRKTVLLWELSFLLTGNRLGLIQKRILYILISEKNEMR